jgi:hypothetical protein
MIHAALNHGIKRRFFGHSPNANNGSTTIQHTTPFADENMLTNESAAQIANFAVVASLDMPTTMHVVTQRIGR